MKPNAGTAEERHVYCGFPNDRHRSLNESLKKRNEKNRTADGNENNDGDNGDVWKNISTELYLPAIRVCKIWHVYDR